jgi:anti-sigma B factor antagonist
MALFTARTSAEGGRVVVALTGECDLAGRDEMETVLLTAVESGKPVRVDLTGVTFLDSSGIHTLVTAYHAARRTGGRLTIANARGSVATVLDMTGVATLLSPDEPGRD